MVPTLLIFQCTCFKTFFGNTIIMIMMEIQYSGTALLLLVNPHISHQNNGTERPNQLSSEKKKLCFQLCSTHYTAVRINNCLKITSAIKVAPIKITDDLLQMETIPQNQHFLW